MIGRREHTVDLHLAVRDDGLDLSLLLEVLEALAGQGAVNLEPVDKGGDGDETVGLDVLVQLVGSGLVEDDGVLGLVLDCRRLLAVDATLESRPHRDAVGLRGASDARPKRRALWPCRCRGGASRCPPPKPVHPRRTKDGDGDEHECSRTLSLGPLLLLLLRAGSGGHLD